MSATAISPKTENIEYRKLRLINQIVQMEDESTISLLEEIVSEETEPGPALTPEELDIVEKRLANFRAKPDKFTTLEGLNEKIKNLK